MPRTTEIDYFSRLIASLTVTAARARTPEALREVHEELRKAYRDVFSLLSHDALTGDPGELSVESLIGDLRRHAMRGGTRT